MSPRQYYGSGCESHTSAPKSRQCKSIKLRRKHNYMFDLVSWAICKPRRLLETERTEELAKTIWKTISSDSLFPSLLFQVCKNSDKHTIPVFEIWTCAKINIQISARRAGVEARSWKQWQPLHDQPDSVIRTCARKTCWTPAAIAHLGDRQSEDLLVPAAIPVYYWTSSLQILG